MINIIIFFLVFYILLISVLGYGILFKHFCFGAIQNINNQSSIYIGFYGLFLLTFISVISSLFVPHNFIHNILLHLFGVLFFIFYKTKNKKKFLKVILLISLFTASALIISKTHDDFSYYHLPFTKYLTEQKIIFGMGNLLHGYKLLSSLFYLNSIFYLPFIEYYTFHFSLLFFLIFFNFFLLREITLKDNHDVTKFLYLSALVFFNLSFNRIAEYGTDKAGQLLIVILSIKFFQYICLSDKKDNFRNILFILPLLGLCISLKTYFISYLLFGLTLLVLESKFLKILKNIFLSKAFVVFTTFLFVYFLHHFISTGCFISPVSSTCFGNNLQWAGEREGYERLSLWLEQWAKAGAGPNFRVEDPLVYIQNFNWIPRWFNNYFIEKFLDQLLILFFSFLLIFFLFKRLKPKNKIIFLDKKIVFFYLIILAIFFIWFLKHPTLRYGGYSIVFLTLSIPIALMCNKMYINIFFKKRFNFLIILIIIIFNFKNIYRISEEFKRTDHYRFDNFPFFAIPDKKFYTENTSSGLIIYKTDGHCWATPSPCTQSIGKFGFKVKKKNGYYFFIDR